MAVMTGASVLTKEQEASLRAAHVYDPKEADSCGAEYPCLWPATFAALDAARAALHESETARASLRMELEAIEQCRLRDNAYLIEQREHEHQERLKLHTLLDQARNFIDPEQHPNWEADASRELVACDVVFMGHERDEYQERVTRQLAAADALEEAATYVVRRGMGFHSLTDALAAYRTARTGGHDGGHGAAPAGKTG